jgi:hypothetical protein
MYCEQTLCCQHASHVRTFASFILATAYGHEQGHEALQHTHELIGSVLDVAACGRKGLMLGPPNYRVCSKPAADQAITGQDILTNDAGVQHDQLDQLADLEVTVDLQSGAECELEWTSMLAARLGVELGSAHTTNWAACI